MYQEFEKFHSKWKIKEEELGISGHFDKLEFHIIELKKFRECDTMEPRDKNFWLWFIDHTNEEMMAVAYKSNEQIEEARKILNEIQADKALMAEIISRDMEEMDRVTAINRAKREGKVEIAKKLLKMNMEEEKICEATGLSKEEIEKLRAE